MWQALLDPSTGLVNYALRRVWNQCARPGSPRTLALYSVAPIDMYHFTPFVALILLAGLQSIPRLQYEVAEVDGAGAWQTFKMVTLPQLMPSIFLVLLFRLALSLTSFDIISGRDGRRPGRCHVYPEYAGLDHGLQLEPVRPGAGLLCRAVFGDPDDFEQAVWQDPAQLGLRRQNGKLRYRATPRSRSAVTAGA